MKKLNILFIHYSGINGQFFPLSEYLQESGKANTYFLGGAHWFGDLYDPKRHFIIEPDGNIDNPTYYYLWWGELATRIAVGIYRKVQEIQKQIPIDVIVGHHLYGSLSLLYDESILPLITYLEHPSFRHYKWDPKYPPTEGQILHDKAFEMLSYFHLFKSDRTIVPSEYTKSMIPEKFLRKVTVIPDAVKTISQIDTTPVLNKKNGIIYIGFTARTLTSEKGFEQFIKISRALLKIDPKFHFIIIGSTDGISYGYDKQNVQSLGYNNFKEYLLRQYPIQEEKYTFYDFLPYEQYSSIVNDIDIFLYPLQYGSATWGLFELFLRGKPIIASNRCFIPEVIVNGQNGILCEYEDIDGWINTILDLAKNPEKQTFLSRNARKSTQKYSFEKIAEQYLGLFQEVIKRKKEENQ